MAASAGVYEKRLTMRLNAIKTVIDDHMRILLIAEQRKNPVLYHDLMSRTPLQKLYILMANEKKLHRIIDRSKDDRTRARLRMVSLTQSYHLQDSP